LIDFFGDQMNNYLRTYKYRIYPNKAQQLLFEDYMETCRKLFNHFLRERINTFELKKHLLYQHNCQFLKENKKLSKIKKFLNCNDVLECDMMAFSSNNQEDITKFLNEAYKVKVFEGKPTNYNYFNFNDFKFIWDIELIIRKFSLYTQNYDLKFMKTTNDKIRKIPSTVLEEVPERLHKTFNNFFNNRAGYPRFKKFGTYNSLRFRNSCKSIVTNGTDLYHSKNFSLKDGKLILSTIKNPVAIILHRMIPAFTQLKTCIISKKADNWFACITFEYYQPTNRNYHLDIKKVVGIDVGIKQLLALSSPMSYRTPTNQIIETDSISTPQFLKQFDKDIAKAHRSLARKKKISFEEKDILEKNNQGKNRYKAIISLQKIYDKLYTTKEHFLYTLTTQLVEQFDYIIIEDLDVSKMVKPRKKANGENHQHGERSLNRGFNKALLEVSFYRIRQMLINKCNELGKQLILIDPAYTSINCSSCGKKIWKSLSTRTHKCYYCGLELDRDKNASLNILKKGLYLMKHYL